MMMMMVNRLPYGRIHIMRSMMIQGSIVAATAATDAVVVDTVDALSHMIDSFLRSLLCSL